MKPSRKKCRLSEVVRWASVTQHRHSEGWSGGRRIAGSRSPLERKQKKEKQGLGSEGRGKNERRECPGHGSPSAVFRADWHWPTSGPLCCFTSHSAQPSPPVFSLPQPHAWDPLASLFHGLLAVPESGVQ